MGVLVTLWLVRVALIFYVAALGRWLSGRAGLGTRTLWTVGCVLLSLHAVAAFGVFHDWSHARAWRHTADETQATIGLPVGLGVYFNYLFVLLWIADVAWWWASPASYLARPRWLLLSMHGYLAFIVFNAVVVFESGPLRWLGVMATLGLAAIWWKWQTD